MDKKATVVKEMEIANGAFERCVNFMSEMIEKYADSVCMEKVEKSKN